MQKQQNPRSIESELAQIRTLIVQRHFFHHVWAVLVSCTELSKWLIWSNLIECPFFMLLMSKIIITYKGTFVALPWKQKSMYFCFSAEFFFLTNFPLPNNFPLTHGKLHYFWGKVFAQMMEKKFCRNKSLFASPFHRKSGPTNVPWVW